MVTIIFYLVFLILVSLVRHSLFFVMMDCNRIAVVMIYGQIRKRCNLQQRIKIRGIENIYTRLYPILFIQQPISIRRKLSIRRAWLPRLKFSMHQDLTVCRAKVNTFWGLRYNKVKIFFFANIRYFAFWRII